MTENELPEWVVSAAQDAQAYTEQAQGAAAAFRVMIPVLQHAREDAQEYAEVAGQALEMMARLIAEYVQRDTEQMRPALAALGLLLAYADQTVLSMNLGLLRPAEYSAVGRPRHHTASADLTVTPTFAPQPQHHTRSASLTIAPVFSAHVEVVKAADGKDVDAKSDTSPDTRRAVDLAALGVKFLIALALIFPMVQAHMSAEDQEILNSYIGTIALALTVAWRYQDTHKH